MKTKNQSRKSRYEGGIIAPFIIAAGFVAYIAAMALMYN